MAYTLLMRLSAPMQAWGVSSRFSIRETLHEPSKSGVIGLLCAALGWDRAAVEHPIAGRSRTLAHLAALRMAVRVVREGVVRRDYHTAQQVLRAKTKLRPGKTLTDSDVQNTVLSERYYLSDAYFLVGLESDDEELLRALDAALAAPHWPLCLGRKAFIPSYPVRYAPPEADASGGVVPLPLVEALLAADDLAWHLLTSARRGGWPKAAEPVLMPTTRLVVDADVAVVTTTASPAARSPFALTRTVQLTDVPLSFEPRRFAPRDVAIYTSLRDVPLQA